eukprot:7056182-Pyramimonas_sp.AAC.1
MGAQPEGPRRRAVPVGRGQIAGRGRSRGCLSGSAPVAPPCVEPAAPSHSWRNQQRSPCWQ